MVAAVCGCVHGQGKRSRAERDGERERERKRARERIRERAWRP